MGASRVRDNPQTRGCHWRYPRHKVLSSGSPSSLLPSKTSVHQETAHKVHAAPLPTRSLEDLANRSVEPGMRSLMTHWTPRRPRAARSRRNAAQKGASSLRPLSKPKISLSPAWVTSVATTKARLITRSPSRTFRYWASSQTYGSSPGPPTSVA